MGERELNVHQALKRISSSSATERKEGLADLEHIFKHNKNSFILESLRDKTWHNIYETLFQCATLERSAYLKASHSQKRTITAAVGRLSACAKVLRITVTAGLRTIRVKTVKALLHHIIQTLPVADGGYCEGLSLEYIKCLRIITEYQPHVEHLREIWHDVVDFCLEGISMLQSQSQDEGFALPASNGTSSLRTPNGSLSISMNRRSRAGTPKPIGGRSHASSDFKREIDDLVACMRHLTNATNAPLQIKGGEILDVLVHYLRSTDAVRTAHSDAFASVNAVLYRISSSSIAITRNAILQLYPVVKDLWPTKTTGLKDEMLTTLIYTKTHISSILDISMLSYFKEDLENLLDMLQSEYAKRLERDQLQVDNLELTPCSEFPNSPVAITAFRLRRGNVTAESQWSIISLIAYYSHLLDTNKQKLWNDKNRNGDEEPSKKLKISFVYQDYIRRAAAGSVSSQICYLQALAFMPYFTTYSDNQLEEFINRLSIIATDSNGAVASWAMIALTSCAFQKSSASILLGASWNLLFQLIARTIVTQACSRAACHLMDVLLKLKLVQYSSVAAILENMLSSVELHGPAIFTDSSSNLWITLMQLKASENPSAGSGISERVLRWTFSKWTPSKLGDKNYAVQTSANHRPGDVIALLDACSDRSLVADDPPSFACHGSVAQAWLRASHSKSLSEYLLLIPPGLSQHQQMLGEKRSAETHSRNGRSSVATDILILESCCSETERVIAVWTDWLTDRPQSLLPDMLRLVSSLCIVNGAMVSRQDGRNKRRLDILRKLNEKLLRSLTEFLSQQECDQEKVDAVLDQIIDHLPSIASVLKDAEGTLISFALHLSKSLELRRHSKQSRLELNDEDLMEIENDGFDSQMSENRTRDDRDNTARDITAMTSDPYSFRSCIAAYVYLLSCTFQTRIESMSAVDIGHIPAAFVRRMKSLSPSEFCACRPMFSMIFHGSLPMMASDLDSLLEYIADEFMMVYEFERHEVVHTIELDLLNGCASLWTDLDVGQLKESASSVYAWFIEIGLENNLCSPGVQLDISTLFITLLEVRGPDYKPSSALPSVRTGLFGLLSTGEIPVKYYICKRIPQFFNSFTLGEHEHVFDDIRKNLPEDDQCVEEMAIRLLAFAYLGSQWHTLLRRCVYHIFETAGAVELTMGHATHCMAIIATSLRLETPRDLFKLFASQLLFTWLDKWGIDTIPFRIFSYASLEDLLIDVQDEVFAQVVMRSKDANIADLSARLSSSTAELLKQNFSKTAAYCFGWDIDNAASAPKGQPQTSSETKVKALLDKKEYPQLLQKHFPTIIAIFIYATDSGTAIDKALSKRDHTQHASGVLAEMRKASASGTILPADQQPLFKAKLLTERINKLCRRTGLDDTAFWTAELYIFVLRMLLSKIHPALGSLYACSIVRKIRVLVAMSGNVPFSGYPLEATLHALRPLLVDKQCAEDTLGIFQYLLSNGVTYLATQISFISGLVMSTLISLRKFVGSSQESTTQESQHRATIGKADAFHKWLVGSFSPELTKEYGADDTTIRTYTAFIKGAAVAHQEANAMVGSTESEVLQLILEDQRRSKRLLKAPARDLIFGLLCSEFAPPPSYRNDVLGHDKQAAALATEVWESCRHTKVSKQYLLWAARVLGRAHNATGWTVKLRHSSIITQASEVDTELPQLASKQVILQTIVDLLFSVNRQEVGIVEETLRSILIQTASVEELNDTQQLLPPSVVSALTLLTTDVTVRLNVPTVALESCLKIENLLPFDHWIGRLTIALTSSTSDDSLIGALGRVLYGVEHLAETLFAPILHLVLLQDVQSQQKIRQVISSACRVMFKEVTDFTAPHVKALLSAVLYLRKRRLPQEVNPADRTRWLDLDYTVASRAAETCGMHSTALLFAETSVAQPVKSSRRSSTSNLPQILPDDLLLSIFKNIDELDSFYGVQQNPGLISVLDRLDYETDGFKSLLFRGARLDSQMRRLQHTDALDAGGLIRSLVNLNLNSVTHSLLSNQDQFSSGINMVDDVLHTARKLEQWDIRAPDVANTEPSTTFKVFQGLSNATDTGSVRRGLDNGFLNTIQSILSPTHAGLPTKAALRTLGILTEVDDVMGSISPETLRDAWKNMVGRETRMHSAPVDDIRPILSSRETLFSILSRNTALRERMNLKAKDVRAVEVEVLISSCTIARQRNALQESLATATYLSDLVPACKEIGLDIDLQAQNEVADVLWDQGEHSTSIRMLQRLTEHVNPEAENSGITMSRLLAKLGHHVAEARLEQPEEIMNRYLAPAISELSGLALGPVAGQVFHQFASFCDNQLSNADAVEDFSRVQRIRQRRQEELGEWENTIRKAKSTSEKARSKSEYRKVEKWFKLDDHEYQRLRSARESFMTQSLENYLLSLSASDAFDNDVLRFFSLWLEYADSIIANTAVRKHLDKVPSSKFARLMNQLSSRLQYEDSQFQSLLSGLILRIATDHPYHAMFHISAGTNTLGIKDESGRSRVNAAKQIAHTLSKSKTAHAIWNNVHATNQMYHNLAVLKNEEGEMDIFKAGREVKLDAVPAARMLANRIKEFRVPPPTMSIALRADMDYKNVPRIVSFKPSMSIANGLSAPKILTALCTDGQRFKQLFKGGHDDLRQDAIMEQVFEEVSKILKNHTATRQRNLLIRTYKVLPLSAQSGIMEFVQNTMALQDVLIPLHDQYYPKEFNTSQCRKKINDAVQHSAETRVKVFKEVMARFSPVMRFFFFENFVDPDEWFEKRLAYTRSTAAISVLGHIVGLGDRHLHNILLDRYSGEVVHIDLGVAFEAGRVLPVPEVVPFRLTRDLVDGMGYTKTEGVFRRCCEFTLDALREERESIMTLLNVLRYDPLYSWSVSPLKAKRLQETEGERVQLNEDHVSDQASKRKEDDVGEAGRALTVVEKKLSKTLSTQATVSELIAQATDERNLAVLFAGWSAWV